MKGSLATNGSCHGLECGSTDLVEAHIIPAGFARILHRPGGHNLALNAQGGKRAKNQNGEFDPGILCSACDQKIGALDEYGLRVSQRFPKGPYSTSSIILDDVDGDRFALFVLAVLWRASISTRPAFEGISLGPYEAPARGAIFGAKPLKEIPEFALIANRYWSAHLDATEFYSIPTRSRMEGLNIIALGLGGFQLVAKLDKRPMPSIIRGQVVNGRSQLRCLVVELERTGEFATMAEAAVAQKRRNASNPWGLR